MITITAIITTTTTLEHFNVDPVWYMLHANDFSIE